MKGALTQGEKYAYNTLILLFTTLLALNMTVAHSQFVLLIREGYIFIPPRDDRNHHPYRFDEKFPRITGLRSALTFMVRGKGHTGAIRASSTFVLVWVFCNLGVAIGIALIGLTYSLEDGGVGRRPGGFVSIVDTRNFYPVKSNRHTPDLIAEGFVAKMYADVSISYENTTSSNPGKDDEYQLEELDDGWRYNFREMDPKETGIMLRSDRYIKTSARCTSLKINHWDPDTKTLNYTESDRTNQSISIFVVADRTVYLSGLDEKNLAPEICATELPELRNPRCGWMGVVQIIPDNMTNSWLYDCHSTVEEVSGAKIPEHQVSDKTALIAATSLSQSSLFDEYGQMYGYYMNGVRWGETGDGDPKKIAKMVSRASAGAIAAMDQLNPRIKVSGSEPWKGVHLKVQWKRLIPLLVVIGAVQLIAATVSIIWHSKNLKPSTGNIEVEAMRVLPKSDPNAQPATQVYPSQGGVFSPALPQSPPPNYAATNNGQYQHTDEEPQPGSNAHV